MVNSFIPYQVDERSYVAYFKREIHTLISRAKFGQTQAAEIDIIVSEISSNLIKHAGKGQFLYRVLNSEETGSIFEIISIDEGPGMSDTARMLRDGVSTTKTLGQGLGAIHRLSSKAQVFSMQAWGTILYAAVRSQKKIVSSEKSPDLAITALCVNKPREEVCGDGYRVKRTDSETIIFFGDGLGHGEHAKAAVDQAGDFFFECAEIEPVEIIRQMHEKVRRTRGLVATVALFDTRTSQWKICGVGNILTRMYNGISNKNHMSYNGTIGLVLPSSMTSSVFNIEKNQHLIMCSDGIQTRWDLNRYPSIFKYDNMMLAAALYKDFTRGNDDSSILIAKVV